MGNNYCGRKEPKSQNDASLKSIIQVFTQFYFQRLIFSGEKFNEKSHLQATVRNWKATLYIDEKKNKQLINGMKKI